jgi:hypothetical protein
LKSLAYLPLLLIAVVPVVQRRIDARMAGRRHDEVLYLWSGEHIRRLSPGFENVMADVYWLRTVQYFGEQRVFATDKRFDLLAPLVNITTEIDPRLEIAYRYGATFLAEPWPTGAGQPQAGIAVLRRGIENNPRDWKLRQDLGLFYMFFLDDPEQASKVLLEGSAIAGAPPILKALAAQTLSKGGKRRTSEMLWEQIRDQSEPGQLKDNANVHLAQLRSLDAVDALNAAAAEFARRAGRPPSSLEELRRSGFSSAPAVDAAGTPFEYNATTGKVSLSPRSPLWRRELAS